MAGAKETKQEPDPNAGTENGSAEGGEKGEGSEGGSGGGDSGRSLREYVEEVVRSVMDTGSSGDSGSAADTGKKPERSSAAGTEYSIAALVREEQAKLMRQQEKDAGDKKRDEEIAALKKVTERPPARTGPAAKIQRFLWGE